MPLLSSYGGIFCVNYVTMMLQHKSERGFLLLFFFGCCCCPDPSCCTPVSSAQHCALGRRSPQQQEPLTRRGDRPEEERLSWQQTKQAAAVSPEPLMSGNMKYKKFITIMQAALGVAPLNKRELIPPPRKLWKPAR